MDPLVVTLISAIVSLAGVVAALYRRGERLHDELNDVRRELGEVRRRSTELLFALLGQRRAERGERSPPTMTSISDFEDENTGVTERAFLEATAHASSELNGEKTRLLREYLESTSTPVPARVRDSQATTKKISDAEIRAAQREVDRTIDPRQRNR